MSSARLGRNALQANLLGSLLGPNGIVLLHTQQVLLSALGRHDVLDLDVNSLLDDAVSHLLVDLHTNSSLSHIKNNSSATMISLERHTLMAGSVGYNINVVTNMVGAHESRERNHSMTAEWSLEHVASTGTITVSVRHSLNDVSSAIPQILHTSTKTCFLGKLKLSRKR